MSAKRFKRTYGLIFLLTLIFCTFFSEPSPAESQPSFNIGGYGGVVVPMFFGDDAYTGSPYFIDEPVDSWSATGTFGIGALYRLNNGWGLELFAEKMIMSIEDDAGKWGELDIAPIFFLIKYQSLPQFQTGYAYHYGGGLGFASSDFTATRAGTSGWNSKMTALFYSMVIWGWITFFRNIFPLHSIAELSSVMPIPPLPLTENLPRSRISRSSLAMCSSWLG